MNFFLTFWHRLIRWSGWTGWLKWPVWKRIGRWPGWTSWLKWPCWSAIARWTGWKRLLFPHAAVLSFLVPACAAGLMWVFLFHREAHPLAYTVYCLSFYTLVVFCLQLPAAAKGLHTAILQNRWIQRYLQHSALHFRVKLYLDQFINFLYGLFKIWFGFLSASMWISADGLYNLVQGVLQLAVILRGRNQLDVRVQWKTYRFCGALMILLALPIAGMVLMVVQTGAHKEYPGLLIFVTALFAFYKLPSAFVRVAKDRRHTVPTDSAVRLLKLSQAFFSMFSLQAAMIHQFGGGEAFATLMNSLTGSAVCVLVALMGIYMLWRGRRDLNRTMQENDHEQ